MTLVLKNVNTYYDKSHILHDVSMSIEEKEVVGLLGRNGVGKSTTLKSISGVVTPRSGSILYQGKELCGLKPHQVSRLGIGYVPEERRIFPNLSVYQNLLIGIQRQRKDRRAEQAWTVERAYDLFPQLKARQSSKGGNLSGGEQQMLTIVRTLMGNPDLLLLDEPTEGLAPMLVEVVSRVIREIHGSGLSILLVEQNFEVILDLASRTYVMSKGQVVFRGGTGELAEDREVRKKYLEV